jgi:hypothetical protein
MPEVLRVQFKNYSTVREKRPYIIYEIEVGTTIHSWVIYKRYSDFYTFHQQLLRLSTHSGDVPGENIDQADAKLIQALVLPAKHIVNSMAVEVVEKRKSDLEGYLKMVLNIRPLRQSNIVHTFLEVQESVRPMLKSTLNRDTQDRKDAEESLENYHKSFNAEERRIRELIRAMQTPASNFEHKTHKVAAVRTFEQFFFDERPQIDAEQIRLLLLGTGPNGDGGLVKTCGDFRYSHVASRAALYLLCRLLDVEKNKDALAFQREFLNLDPNILKQMELQVHILAGNRLGAFRLVSLLSSSTDRKTPSIPVEQIIVDADALTHYHRWAERNSQQVVSHVNETKEKSLKSLNVIDDGTLESQTAATVAELRAVLTIAETFSLQSSSQSSAKNSDGSWATPYSHHTPASSPISSQPSPMLLPFAAGKAHESGGSTVSDQATPWRVVKAMVALPWDDPKSSETNFLLRSGAVPNRTNFAPDTGRDSKQAGVVMHGMGRGGNRQAVSDKKINSDSSLALLNMVQVQYRKNIARDLVQMVASCTVPFPPSVVATLLKDIRRRREWDVKFVRGRRLERLSENSDVVCMVFKSFSSPYKYRDFCFLRAAVVDEDGTHVLAAKSILHRAGPEQKDNIRAVLFASGYVLSPLEAGHHTKLSFITQMDKESVLIVSPDLLGETNELRQSMLNITTVLQRDMQPDRRANGLGKSPASAPSSASAPQPAPVAMSAVNSISVSNMPTAGSENKSE